MNGDINNDIGDDQSRQTPSSDKTSGEPVKDGARQLTSGASLAAVQSASTVSVQLAIGVILPLAMLECEFFFWKWLSGATGPMFMDGTTSTFAKYDFPTWLQSILWTRAGMAFLFLLELVPVPLLAALQRKNRPKLFIGLLIGMGLSIIIFVMVCFKYG